MPEPWKDALALLPGEVGSGVTVSPLARTTSVSIFRWRCSAGPSGATAELRQPWQLVSFTHVGTFMLHVGGRTEMIDATRAMLIGPGEAYRMTRASRAVASGSGIAIRPDLFAALFPVRAGGLRHVVPSPAFLLQHLILHRAEAAALLDPAELDDALLWIAAQVMRPDSRTLAPRARGGFIPRGTVADVQTLLAAKFTEAVQLGDLAEAVSRSPYHLCRTFKRETGMQLHHYLNRLRLRSSLDRILERRASLSDLAGALGYSSHSHFGAAFREEFHTTPSEFRRLAALPRLSEMRNALERDLKAAS